MGYEFVISFKKPFTKCTVPLCKNKHHGKGLCLKHYNQGRERGEYRYTFDEYLKIKKNQNKSL